jgi:translation initiation factor 1
VSVVTGLAFRSRRLKELCRLLKQKCGVGGTVKDFTIEIQGDKRAIIQTELEKRAIASS